MFTHILNVSYCVWFGFMAYLTCRLFNAKYCLHTYTKYRWFGLVGFYSISTIVGFHAKSCLYIYIKYIGFGSVGFYGISGIICYLMANPVYSHTHTHTRVHTHTHTHTHTHIHTHKYIYISVATLAYFCYSCPPALCQLQFPTRGPWTQSKSS